MLSSDVEPFCTWQVIKQHHADLWKQAEIIKLYVSGEKLMMYMKNDAEYCDIYYQSISTTGYADVCAVRGDADKAYQLLMIEKLPDLVKNASGSS